MTCKSGPIAVFTGASGASDASAESTVLFDQSFSAGHGNPAVTSFGISGGSNIIVGGGSNGTVNVCLFVALTFGGANGGTSTSPTVVWDLAGANQSMTQIPGAYAQNGASGGDTYWFYLMNPVLGTHSLTVNWTGANQLGVYEVSFVGVDQTGGTTSFPTVVTPTGTGAATATISTSPTTRKIVAAFNSATNFTAPANGTDIGHDDAQNVFATAAIWDNGTATSMTYNPNTTGYDAVAFVIKGASGGSGTMFDLAHNTNATLSNGGLTALFTGGGNSNMGAYTISTNTTNQKVYVEATVVHFSFGGEIGFGNNNTAGGRDPGTASPSTGFAVQTVGQFICADSVDHGTGLIPAFTTGDVLDVAADFALSKFWVRKNNGAWNASQGGTQDPATSQGGVTFSPVVGPFYFFVGADALNGDGWTARFSSTSWTHTAPSGFSQLG